MDDEVKCVCGWMGRRCDLIHTGSATHADEWWECPQCRRDGSEMMNLELPFEEQD